MLVEQSRELWVSSRNEALSQDELQLETAIILRQQTGPTDSELRVEQNCSLEVQRTGLARDRSLIFE